MPINESLLAEFGHEMMNTRKTLERVPDDKLGWKPHEKSGTMGWLASHVADIPSWVVPIIEKDEMDLAAPGASLRPAEPRSRQELVAAFDKSVAEARAALANVSDERLAPPWTLRMGETVIFTLPRAAVLRSMILNHLIHHRGQLTMYLRLNNVPVPALYGPSADEGTL